MHDSRSVACSSAPTLVNSTLSSLLLFHAMARRLGAMLANDAINRMILSTALHGILSIESDANLLCTHMSTRQNMPVDGWRMVAKLGIARTQPESAKTLQKNLQMSSPCGLPLVNCPDTEFESLSLHRCTNCHVPNQSVSPRLSPIISSLKHSTIQRNRLSAVRTELVLAYLHFKKLFGRESTESF